MTSDPIILSVPHTGTRFLRERLGVEDHIHLVDPWSEVWTRIMGRHIIVPLRAPVDSWRSWCRRHDPDNFPYAQWMVAWGLLQVLDSVMDLDIICVDKQQDSRITDWSKVGDGDRSRADWKLIKTDLRPVYTLPVVSRHYGHS